MRYEPIYTAYKANGQKVEGTLVIKNGAEYLRDYDAAKKGYVHKRIMKHSKRPTGAFMIVGYFN